MAAPDFTDDRLAALVDDMLSDSPPRVSECFTVETVRECLTRSFDFWAQARAEEPDDGQRPLWDLRMYDGDPEDAAFVVWVWEPEAVWLAAGTGDSYEVRSFCGQRAACECDGLFIAMGKLFRMPTEPVALPSPDVERWISRSWNDNEPPG